MCSSKVRCLVTRQSCWLSLSHVLIWMTSLISRYTDIIFRRCSYGYMNRVYVYSLECVRTLYEYIFSYCVKKLFFFPAMEPRKCHRQTVGRQESTVPFQVRCANMHGKIWLQYKISMYTCMVPIIAWGQSHKKLIVLFMSVNAQLVISIFFFRPTNH